MKWLFLFLFLANLALAAWGQFGRGAQPNPLVRQEIHADRIRMVPILPKKPAPAPQATACYRWGTFSGAAIEAARDALAAIDPGARASEHVLKKPDTLGFWAYIPPKPTKADALESIRKLDAIGVRDHFLIQDSGKWQYAISLGIFKTADAANRYAAGLRKKGVSSAVSGRRDSGESEFLMEGLGESAAKRITQLEFPGAQLEKIDCPSPEKSSRD